MLGERFMNSAGVARQHEGTPERAAPKAAIENRWPIVRMPTVQEIAIAQRLACKDPMFQKILSSPEMARLKAELWRKAQSTPNKGEEGDIPRNGSEYGAYLGERLLSGKVVSGRQFTTHRERQVDFDPKDQPYFSRNITAVHTHQSPRGSEILSGKDINITRQFPFGQHVNVIAIEKDGTLYCKRAQ